MRPSSLLRAPGLPLDEREWRRRHRRVVAVLVAQLAVLAATGPLLGHDPLHVAADVLPFAVAAAIACAARVARLGRECAATIGLFGTSSVIVHFAGGAEALHFHYFVMLVLLAQYEDVRPFALGIAYVVVEHLLVGSAASLEWALVHGGFVLATAVALRSNWRANEAARERERAARAEAQGYLDVAGALLVALDADGRVRTLNRRAQHVLGRPGDAAGEDWFALAVPEAHRAEARRRHAALVRGEEPEPLEVDGLVAGAGGEPRRIAWHVRRTYDAAGATTGTLSSGEDVTERVAAQRALRRERDDLEVLRRLAQAVASRGDARDDVVRALAGLTGAPVAVLWERSDDGGALEVTACAGAPGLRGARIVVAEEPSAAGTVLRTGRPLFVGETDGGAAASARLRALTGMAALHAHPVRVDGAVAAVVALVWREPVATLDDRTRSLVDLVADEASVALARLAGVRRLEAAARTDVLTGVPNRRAWDEALPRELERAARTGRPLAVALLDLNEFKAVNDRLGHGAGDRVLRAAAGAWLAELRTTDVLARLGGDEFAIVLPDCGPQDAAAVAGRLRRATPHRAGCALGIVQWEPGEDAEALVRRADRALYEDKALGGAHVLDDPERLAAVRETGLLDGVHTAELDHLTELVRWLVDVPVALVTLVTDERQAFAAQTGLTGWPADDGGTPLSHSFCRHPVATRRPLVVEDARAHPLVRDNPAIADLEIVAYAGFPLQDGDGRVLGVLCAIDHRPRPWTPDELTTLRQLAGRAARHLAARALDGRARTAGR